MPACGPVRLIAGTPRPWSAIDSEGRALVLAGGEQDVELARVGLVGDRRREAEQLVGRVAHRGHDDDEVAPGGALAGDPPRDALDPVGVGDATSRRTSGRRGGQAAETSAEAFYPVGGRPASADAAARPATPAGRDDRLCDDVADHVPPEARAMCFDLDSRPPIAPIAGGALDQRALIADRRRRQPVRGVPGAGRRAERGRRS